MKLSMKSIVLAAVVAATSQFAGAAILTQWNFNSVVPDNNASTGSSLPSIGAGTLATVGGVTNPSFNSGVGSSDLATDNSGFQTTTYPAATVGNKTAGIEVRVSTVGFESVTVGYDLRHSNTSSRFEQVQISIDGVSFVDVGGLFDGNAGDTWFNGRSVDLSSIAGVANNANFAFRVVSAFDPAAGAYVASRQTPATVYAGGGTWRFDMVTVSANVIPEPSALGLLAPAGLLLARRRK